MNTFIDITNVTKIYANGFRANDNLTLSVDKGEVVGLVGPNGAGKTTLIRQVLGLLRPTAGKVTLLGTNPVKSWDRLRGSVGYVPQMPIYYPSLTVRETVKFVLLFMGFKGNGLEGRITETLELVGLDKAGDRFGYQLSHGSMRLLLLAMALCQDPAVLILDEPTSMLDIVNRVHVQNLVTNQKGKGILLASHDMAEVKNVCDRIYLMIAGKFVAQGTPLEISALTKLPTSIVFVPSDAAKAQKLIKERDIPVESNGSTLEVSFDELKQGIEFANELVSISGLDYLHVEAPSIEKALLRLMEGAEHE
jgi:ABC-2 type transport system ATP-binding protein